MRNFKQADWQGMPRYGQKNGLILKKHYRFGSNAKTSLKRFILFFSMTFILASCSKKEVMVTLPETLPAPTLKSTTPGYYAIATFNIRYNAPDPGNQNWSVRRPLIKDMIVKYDFDVFGTQEGLGTQISNMLTDLPAYAKIGVGRDGNTTSEHSAIFYKTAKFSVISSGTFWLSPGAPTTATGPSWDAAYKRICTWAEFMDKTKGQIFWVFNAHFDHVGTTARDNSAALVLSQMQAKIGYWPAIFMGDLNCNQTSSPVLTLKNSALLEETWDIAPVKSPVSRQTANAWNINPPGNEQIDHIFVSNLWTVNSRKVLWDNYSGVLPSDHFPVLSEVKFTWRVASDFNFDAKAEAALFSNGVWKVNGMTDATWGVTGDIPVPADYNGDSKIDKAIFRPSTSTWWVENITTGVWGLSGDIPVPADFNGDGATDYAVWRPSNATWYILNGATQAWGNSNSTDIPVPGDYNGDAKADFAVFRPTDAKWYIKYSNGSTGTYAWGNANSNDIPVPADYSGDGIPELAIFRPVSATTAEWWIKPNGAIQFGQAGDIPAPADYNGDGIAEMAVWRPSNNTFYIRNGATIAMGSSGYKPVALPWHIRKFFFP